MDSNIVVVGSLNMDFVVQVDHLPAPGETVLGGGFQMIPGGKGANQAVAAGKLAAAGMRVKMIGRVGYDVFGDQLKASLSAAGVDVAAVHATRAEPTGVALISVDRRGQNSIVVASGANGVLAAAEIEGSRPVFQGATVALFQLETPLDTVAAALRLAHEAGAKTVLDPAPAQPLSREILERVDILTPNESEACILLGQSAARVTSDNAPEFARALLGLGARAVILKMGEAGCFYTNATESLRSPGFEVEVRDTTAAGDTFNAALAVALSESRPMAEAMRFANAAAAVSVTRLGAQASAPTRGEVEALLKR
jgi:ribokinase